MDTKDVEKIYNLANLSLEGKDVEDISNKFNIVLDFIESIFNEDTEGIELTEMITTHKAIFRKDEPHESVDRDLALKNAADKEYGYFRVDWKL